MNTLKTAGILFALFTLLLGVVYPLAMTGIAQVVFPHKANGSLLVSNSFEVPGVPAGEVIALHDWRDSRLLLWHF